MFWQGRQLPWGGRWWGKMWGLVMVADGGPEGWCWWLEIE